MEAVFLNYLQYNPLTPYLGNSRMYFIKHQPPLINLNFSCHIQRIRSLHLCLHSHFHSIEWLAYSLSSASVYPPIETRKQNYTAQQKCRSRQCTNYNLCYTSCSPWPATRSLMVCISLSSMIEWRQWRCLPSSPLYSERVCQHWPRDERERRRRRLTRPDKLVNLQVLYVPYLWSRVNMILKNVTRIFWHIYWCKY